jgi:nitrate reductase NapE component
MDTYTIALIVLAVAVVGGFGYIMIRPEKSR